MTVRLRPLIKPDGFPVSGFLSRFTARLPEAVDELNKLLRGWSGYFHYRQSTRVFSKTQHWQPTSAQPSWSVAAADACIVESSLDRTSEAC